MEKTVYLVGGNKEITAYIPKNTSYIDLENLYDVCNELFDDDCFYTSTEVRKLKKDRSNKFLRKEINK